MKLKKENKSWIGIGIAIIFYIFIIIGMSTINEDNETNTTKVQNNNKQENMITTYIMSNNYHKYIIDTLQEVNDNNTFNIVASRTRSQYIEIDIQSVSRLTYNDYDIKAKELTNKLYEQIKDKTIKKDGWLSNDDYIINLHFYERFNANINSKKKTAIQVGIYQIYTEDLEKYRTYDKCINGGISELEWKQERK
ncbi:MAG: hypothetical protein HFJ52_03070 [Clostridia bacterium]|nr:hypothetical protein [Clostridia bacterium]